MVSTLISPKVISIAEWTLNPPTDETEWINDELVEKKGITLLHSRIGRFWGNYVEVSGVGVEVYNEVSCNTLIKGRRPDVAYLTSELVVEYGDIPVLQQSFPFNCRSGFAYGYGK
jgi:hypothetical protein